MPITISGAMIHKTRGNRGSFVVREAKLIDCERETAVVEYSRSSLELLVVTKVILKYYDNQVTQMSIHSHNRVIRSDRVSHRVIRNLEASHDESSGVFREGGVRKKMVRSSYESCVTSPPPQPHNDLP